MNQGHREGSMLLRGLPCMAAWLVLTLLVLCLPCRSAEAAAGLVMRASSLPSAPPSERESGPVLRDIFDPVLGLHWQLRIDPRNPYGPRQMVLLNAGHIRSLRSGSAASDASVTGNVGVEGADPNAGATENQRAPVSVDGPVDAESSWVGARLVIIRPGDHITVDQDSEFVHARLQATALEPAAAGETLRVRLSAARVPDLTAPVVSVVATGDGQARWLAVERSAR